jgi:hypothetical protein
VGHCARVVDEWAPAERFLSRRDRRGSGLSCGVRVAPATQTPHDTAAFAGDTGSMANGITSSTLDRSRNRYESRRSISKWLSNTSSSPYAARRRSAPQHSYRLYPRLSPGEHRPDTPQQLIPVLPGQLTGGYHARGGRLVFSLIHNHAELWDGRPSYKPTRRTPRHPHPRPEPQDQVSKCGGCRNG